MFYELFLISVGAAILTIKEAREIVYELCIILMHIIMWAVSLFTEDGTAKQGKEGQEKGNTAVAVAPKKSKSPKKGRLTKRNTKGVGKQVGAGDGSPGAPTLPVRKKETKASPQRDPPKFIRKPSPPPPSRRKAESKTVSGASNNENPVKSDVSEKESAIKNVEDKKEQEKARAKAEKRKVKRANAEREMVDCEETYLGSLTTLQTVYQLPMIKQRKALGLEEKDINVIFSPMLDAIVKLHQAVLEDFRKNGDRKCGEVLLSKAPYFKMYTSYLNGYDAAIDLITLHRKKNKKFEKFLVRQRRADLKAPRWKHMDIASYLIMPVQRIPRYELLLKEIIKNTPEKDSALPSLKRALVMVREAAQHNNQSMRSYQDVQKIVEIQNMLHGTLKDEIIQPSRALIDTFEADVTTISPDQAKEIPGKEWRKPGVPGDWEGRRGRSIFDYRRRQSVSRSPRSSSRTRSTSGSGHQDALANFRMAMEEKIRLMKTFSMKEEKCDIFVFSDILVWVARRNIQHKQGHLEFGEKIKARDLYVSADKSVPAVECLLASDAVSLRVRFATNKGLEKFKDGINNSSLAEHIHA